MVKADDKSKMTQSRYKDSWRFSRVIKSFSVGRLNEMKCRRLYLPTARHLVGFR